MDASSNYGASDSAQPLEMPAAKSDDLNSIPGIHMV